MALFTMVMNSALVMLLSGFRFPFSSPFISPWLCHLAIVSLAQCPFMSLLAYDMLLSSIIAVSMSESLFLLCLFKFYLPFLFLLISSYTTL